MPASWTTTRTAWPPSITSAPRDADPASPAPPADSTRWSRLGHAPSALGRWPGVGVAMLIAKAPPVPAGQVRSSGRHRRSHDLQGFVDVLGSELAVVLDHPARTHLLRSAVLAGDRGTSAGRDSERATRIDPELCISRYGNTTSSARPISSTSRRRRRRPEHSRGPRIPVHSAGRPVRAARRWGCRRPAAGARRPKRLKASKSRSTPCRPG